MRLVSFFTASLCERSARSPLLDAGARRLRVSVVGVAAMIAGLVPLDAGAGAREVASEALSEPGLEEVTRDDLLRDLAEARTEQEAATARRALERRRVRSGSAAADLLVARAGVARAAGDTGTALDLLDAAITVAPTWATGRRLRGLMRLERGDLASASLDLAEAIRGDPTDAGALTAAAVLHERRGEAARALDLLRRAARLDPRLPGVAEAIERLTPIVEGRPL